jgi:hypothetical protein
MVVAYYAWFLCQHAVNIPKADDITDVLMVVSAAVQSQDYGEFFKIFWQQHNDHRTLSSRIVYWLSYQLQGEIDFRTLIFLSNSGLLLLLSMLVWLARAESYRWWIGLGATLLLFNIRAYDLTLWSMAGFAYFFVFVYGVACICSLHQVTRGKFIGAVALASLATFTLASGQVIWLIGALSLLHQNLVLKRLSNRYFLAWVVAALLVMSLWRLGLETPNTVAELWRLLLLTPLHHFNYLLALLGSASSDSNVLLASLAGVAMTIVLVVSSVRSHKSDDIRLELVCWFIVISAATLALGRAPYTNLEYALASRYAFPSVLMLTCWWVLVASRYLTRRPAIIFLAVALSGIFCVNTYVAYTQPMEANLEKRVKRFNRGQYWIFGTPGKTSKAIVTNAEAEGVYNPPMRPHKLRKLSQ